MLGCFTVAVLESYTLMVVGCSHPPATQPSAPSATESVAQQADRKRIVHLLRQQVVDEDHLGKRAAAMGWHLGDFIPGNATMCKVAYPVHWAKQKIVMEGTPVVPTLLDILADPRLSRAVHFVAAADLTFFDDAQILRNYYDAATCGRLTAFEFYWCLRYHLPYIEHCPPSLNTSEEHRWRIAWVKELLDQDFDDSRLRLLDRFVRNTEAKRYEGNEYEVLLRWLNRHDGENFDAVLAREAPDALAFRNRELAKGYEPVFAFGPLQDSSSPSEVNEQALRLLFSEPCDRKACSELLQVSWRRGGVMTNQGIEDLRKAMINWYWENRSKLRYDFTKHRFVVPE